MKNKMIITSVLLIFIICALLLVVRNKNTALPSILGDKNCVENTEPKNDVGSEENKGPNDTNDSNVNNSINENITAGTESEKEVSSEENKEPNSNTTTNIPNNENKLSNQNNITEKEDSTETTNAKGDKFKVVFNDYDGKVLKTEEVEKGKNAIPPNAPKRKGFIFEKWNVSYENVQTNIVTTANYKEITKPTLVLETISSNDNEVVVKVFIYKNPGLLALVINNTYDEDVIALEKFESGKIMDGYVFTPPKNTKSGCNYAWNINEVPEKVEDGEVLTLHYRIKKPIKTSSPPISITCYDGAFDKNYELVNFEIIN